MAGQNADMTLKVGLDLNFFKQELQKASSSLAGEPVDINVRFSKKSIGDQYNLLSRWLRAKKTFDIKIESNTLNALTDKVANFQKTLKNLKDEKVELSINASANIEKFSKEKIRKIRAQIRSDIVSGGAGEIQLPTKLAAPNTSTFIKDVAKKVKEQTSASYAEGGIPIATRLKVPGITELLKALQKNLNRNPISIATSFKESGKSEAALAKIIRNAEKNKAVLGTELAPLGADEIAEFRRTVESKLSGIKVAINTGTPVTAGVSSGTFKQELGKLDIAELQKIYAAAGESGLLAFNEAITGNKGKLATALNQAASDAGEGFLNGLQDEKSKLFKAAGEYANVLLSGLRKTLKIQSPSKETEDIGQDAGKGFEKGMLASMEKAYDAIEALMRLRNKSLDALARAAFMAFGIDPAALKAAKAQTIQSAAQTMQVARSSSGGLPPNVAGLLPSVTQRTAISQGVQGIYRGLSGQIGEEGPGGALVDVRRIYAALERNLRKIFEVVEVDVQETSMGIKDAMGAFAYLAQALQDAEARTKKAQVGNAVKSLLEKVTGALKAAEAQAVIPVSVRDVTLRPQEPQFRPGSRVPLTMAPQRTLPAAGETTANINRMRIRTGYNMPAPIEANPFYAAPSVPRSRPPYTGAVKTATPRRTPGGFIGVGEAAGGGPEAQAFVDAAKNALRFNEVLNISRKSLDGFRASQLPLVGGLRELGSEFGFALKQVLLFGTAYQGLAFVQSLPGQILNAAKSQQQYNNALQTATQDTGTFAKELVYVDNVQRAFGLNLQTTRDGFTKLYASMAPADFDSGSIEKLFTGISAATAALQLTPDKAERVIYAFGQMASKGQIMSEELKGQLGDVLPGALAIFAKAAGMSVKEFSKAMEDGEFVGQKFRDTFAKVSDELMTRFGTGAQAAGKSLQGLLNTVQGDFARTLESFAPLADAAAQAILGPLGGSLKQLSQSAKIATGEIERTYSQLKAAQQDVSDLRAGGADAKDIKAAEQNVAALAARYTALMRAARDPAIAKQAQDIQKFTEELTKAGTFVMNMAKAIGSVLSPVLNLLGGNLTTVISLLTSFYVGFQAARLAAMALMGALSLYKGLTALLGLGTAATQATALAGAFNVLGVAATGTQVKLVGLRLALTALVATTVIGAVIGGITLIAGAFATMRDRAKEAADESRNAAQAATEAASTGNVAMAQVQEQTILAQSRADKKALETLRKLRAQAAPLRKEGGFATQLTPNESAALMGSELTKGLIEKGGIKQGRRTVALPTTSQMQNLERNFGAVAQEQKVALGEAKAAIVQAQKTAQKIGLNQPTLSTIVETEPPDEKAAEKARRAAEQLAKQQQQRAMELANFQNDMAKIEFDRRIQLSDTQFEHEKRLTDELNAYALSGLNDRHARQVKFAQDLKAIQLNAVDAVRKAMQQMEAAQLNVTAASATASAASVPMAGETIDKSVLRNWLISQGFGRTTGDFTNRGHATPNHMLNAMDMGILGGSDAEALRKTSEMEKKLRATGAFGSQLFGPISDPYGHGAGKGGQNIHLHIPTPGGKVKMTSGLASLMGKQSSPAFSMQTREQKEGFDLAKEQAKAANTTTLAQLDIQNKLKEAYVQTATVIKANIDNIFPVEKQKLDVQLQQMRNNLLVQGMPQEYIDYEEKRTAAIEEGAMALDVMKTNLGAAETELKVYQDAVAKGTVLTVEQSANATRLTGEITAYKDGIASAATKQHEYNIALLEGSIAAMKNADAMKAMQEIAERIDQAVGGITGTYKDMFKEIAKGGDSVEALKKAQEALADQALTMFFDFAMKPVEKFFKDQLGAIFGLPNEEEQRKATLAKMQEQLVELQAIKVATQATANNAAGGIGGGIGGGTQQNALAPGGAIMAPGDAISYAEQAASKLPETVGSITESANAYSEQLSKINASVWENAAEIAPEGGAGKKWQESLGKVVGGLGMAAGSVMGIVAGINQIKEGGTSNVLGGIGMIASMAGSLLGGISSLGGLFGGGGGASAIVQGVDIPASALPPGMAFANGGVARGGFIPFRAFANGGTVAGPTLGLVGEGRYNEAIVPLPDGKSIPVTMNGGQSSRNLLSNGVAKQGSSPVLSMSFQSTTINGVEYVDRAQLEAAMAETRRLAARDGASQGSQLALNKLKNSPTTRRQLGF